MFQKYIIFNFFIPEKSEWHAGTPDYAFSLNLAVNRIYLV